MKNPYPNVLMPAAGRRAAEIPARLNPHNHTFLDDICEILADPEPDPRSAQTVHRWLRDEVETDLRDRLARSDRHLIAWACEMAPRMIWKLPCSRAAPPERCHRLIVAILLPHKLRSVRRELARISFSWQLRASWNADAPPSDDPTPPPES